jgi:hypothetical protein
VWVVSGHAVYDLQMSGCRSKKKTLKRERGRDVLRRRRNFEGRGIGAWRRIKK